MRIFKEFAEWFSKHDQKIIDYHLQKDRENLKRTLRELQEELQEMKALREKIDYLIKESERIVGKGEASLKKEEIKDYTTWLSEAEEKLTRIFKLESNTLSAADREVVQKELPRLRAEKVRLNNRIRKLMEIIAKTKFLLQDLNEDLCRQLSNGHTLAEVGEALAQKFSHEFREDYFSGRDDMCAFLKERYQISHKSACALFDLLEEVGLVHFKMDLSKENATQPILYYGTDWDDPMIDYVTIPPQFMGYWEIKA